MVIKFKKIHNTSQSLPSQPSTSSPIFPLTKKLTTENQFFLKKLGFKIPKHFL